MAEIKRGVLTRTHVSGKTWWSLRVGESAIQLVLGDTDVTGLDGQEVEVTGEPSTMLSIGMVGIPFRVTRLTKVQA